MCKHVYTSYISGYTHRSCFYDRCGRLVPVVENRFIPHRCSDWERANGDQNAKCWNKYRINLPPRALRMCLDIHRRYTVCGNTYKARDFCDSCHRSVASVQFLIFYTKCPICAQADQDQKKRSEADTSSRVFFTKSTQKLDWIYTEGIATAETRT